jgi:hypothetical protein
MVNEFSNMIGSTIASIRGTVGSEELAFYSSNGRSSAFTTTRTAARS